MNSQLRKRPELPLIDDMGNDLQDGILVAKLIEIMSKLKFYTTLLFSFVSSSLFRILFLASGGKNIKNMIVVFTV